MIAEGTLHSDIAATYPLDRVGDAVRHATSAGKGGKVLLRIAEG